jgi:hypothetical protein
LSGCRLRAARRSLAPILMRSVTLRQGGAPLWLDVLAVMK